jgi:hypothetical protein
VYVFRGPHVVILQNIKIFRFHPYALFLIPFYLSSKLFPLLETTGLKIPARYASALRINAPQLLTLIGALPYLGPELFLLIIFYNDALSVITV